jgi:tetratricopeptide (TPR) repeat protein
MSRRFLLVGVIALGGASLGCDTLKARHRATLGAEFYKKGDFRNALYKYEQAAALDPTIDTLHLNLAFSYAQLFSQTPKSREGYEYGGLAVKEFEEYLRRHPDHEKAHNYLVQTFVDTNRYDDAVAYFKPLTDKTPPDLEAISTLGQIAAKTNRMEQALTWYELRVKTNPADADGPYNLGVLIWDHLHNHLEVQGPARLALADRGISALQKAIALRPHASNGFTYLNLIYRERAAGEPDDVAKAADIAEAEKNLKTALDLRKEETPPTAAKK